MESGQSQNQTPELADLTAATELLWHGAQNPAEDQYPGFKVTHDGMRATFTREYSRAMYDQMALFRKEGVWHIEMQTQQPAMETEGWGTVIRTTTDQPLILGHCATKLVETTSLGNTESFSEKVGVTPETYGATELGLAASGCRQLLETMRAIRGESEETQAPKRTRRTWMSRIRHRK